MKKYMILLWLMFSICGYAKTNVLISGVLSLDPCQFSNADIQNVEFGTVIEKYLEINGESPKQQFVVDLTCDEPAQVNISFIGDEAAGLKGGLAFAANSTAKGAAIVLEDTAGQKIDINSGHSVANFEQGRHSLQFNAVVMPIIDEQGAMSLTEGEFESTLTIQLEYP